MKRLMVILILITLLSGCVAYPPPELTGANPVPTTTETSDTTPSADADTQPITEPVVDFDIENFTRLFSIPYDRYAIHPENYYNTAMCCVFSNPEDIPLSMLFYNGFLDGTDVTDEEQAYVDSFLEAKRLEPDQMNAVLDQYFGITLEDINWDAQTIIYWEETGCYYTAGNDMLSMEEFRISKCLAAEDGTITIYYYNGYYGKDFVMTLQSRMKENQYGYRILSNLPL